MIVLISDAWWPVLYYFLIIIVVIGRLKKVLKSDFVALNCIILDTGINKMIILCMGWPVCES